GHAGRADRARGLDLASRARRAARRPAADRYDAGPPAREHRLTTSTNRQLSLMIGPFTPTVLPERSSIFAPSTFTPACVSVTFDPPTASCSLAPAFRFMITPAFMM